MSSERFFVAAWTLPDGGAAAVLLDALATHDGWASATADTPAAATQQLRDLVRWQAKRDGWLDASDLSSAEPAAFKVEVRPTHPLDHGRAVDLGQPLAFTVAAVTGVRGTGEDAAPVCFLPALQRSFDHAAEDDLKPLVQQAVQGHARGLDTREVIALLRPEAVEVRFFTVRELPWSHRDAEALDLPALRAAAEPVLAGASGPAAWGRDEEVRELFRLVEDQHGSAVVLAEPGAGKSTVIAAAAALHERERKQREDEPAAAPRYWRTSAARLVAGMRYLGMWEERCERMVDELSRIDGVLCVENLLDLVKVGSAPGQSPAAFFAPFLAHGDLRVVFEATARELDAVRRLLPGLAEGLPVVRLDPWRDSTATSVLLRICKRLEEQRGVGFDPAAPRIVLALFRRFLPGAAFPGRAGRFLADAFAFAKQLGQPVDADVILDRFAALTGLPDRLLRADLPLTRDEVLGFLTDRVIGQPAPCALLADLAVSFKAALNPPDRPLGCVLLCGPTGTGKTESAKALADFLFPQRPADQRMIRLDMSEYGGPGAAARLTTAPGGGPSTFLRRLRLQPFQVLLLDEIEKADPDVFDLLLGVLDEGRLVDDDGRVTDFRGCFILLTSNIAGGVSAPFGFGGAVVPDAEHAALDVFRPEFFNRLDAVTAFAALDTPAVRRVARLHLSHVAKRRGLARRGLRLRFDDAVVDELVRVGFDPRYGARPLQRAIEEVVVTPLARWLVERPTLRDVELKVGFDAGRLRVAEPGPAAPHA